MWTPHVGGEETYELKTVWTFWVLVKHFFTQRLIAALFMRDAEKGIEQI